MPCGGEAAGKEYGLPLSPAPAQPILDQQDFH
jgi:hypothetical protein